MRRHRTWTAPVRPRGLRLEALEDRRVPAGLGLLSVAHVTPGILTATAVVQTNGAEHANAHSSHADSFHWRWGSQHVDVAIISTTYGPSQDSYVLIQLTFTSPLAAAQDTGTQPPARTSIPETRLESQDVSKPASSLAAFTNSQVKDLADHATSPTQQRAALAADDAEELIRPDAPDFTAPSAVAVSAAPLLRFAESENFVVTQETPAPTQTGITTDAQRLTNVVPREAFTGTTGPVDITQPTGVSKLVRPGIPSLTALSGGSGEERDFTREPAADAPAPPRRDGSDAFPPEGLEMAPPSTNPELPEETKPEDEPLQTAEDLEGWMAEGGLSYWLVGLALTGTYLETVKHRTRSEEETRKRLGLS